jgi:fatty acid synthase
MWLVQIKEKGPLQDDDNSVAAHLLRLMDPATGRRLSDDVLTGEFGMFFTAGLETSGNAITWTL